MMWTCRRLIALAFPLAMGYPSIAPAFDYNLENPQSGTTESGIGLVSGWHCNAGFVQIQIDGGRLIPVPYGSERNDTIGECGDADNGFGFLINYSELGDGAHTITAYASGQAFAAATFQVVTLGAPFLEGISARTTSEIFLPETIRTASLTWSQAKQNFVITGVQDFPYTPAELLGQILGPWIGEWTSADGSASGPVSVTLGIPEGTSLAVTALTLTGTPCSGSLQESAFVDPSPPVAETYATLSDGSTLLLRGIPTATLQAYVGSFLFVDGACAGQEYVFQIFR